MTTNPTPEPTAVDRIPLTHSVHYVARGLPEVPNHYGPGVLAPSEITLTYRAAPDSQLGRVHAYVAGRIWVDGTELPLMTGGLYGQHYDDGLDGWPAWLAEEARLHAPAASAVVAVAVPPTGQTALRDRIRRVLAQVDGFDFDSLEPHDYQIQAAALLAVLPPPVDRADILREVADICDEAGAVYASKDLNGHADAAFRLMERFQRKAAEAEYVATPCSVGGCEPGGEPCTTHERLMAHAEGDHELCAPDCGTTDGELRRLADEAQQQPGGGPDRCSGCRFVPCGDCCPACSAGIEHTEHCPTPESHNWGCGCPGDRLPLHAESGVDTPGCDCGHNGMGPKWHGATCEWMSIPPCDHCGRRGHSFEDCPSADAPAASAGVQTDAPEPPRSRTARFLDAVTHSGPGYDLIPDAGVQTDEETSR